MLCLLRLLRVRCARGRFVFRVHYKNTRETCAALKGLTLKRAQRFLEDVIAHKDIVPYFRHGGKHKAQCKKHKSVSGRWPEKSCRFMLDLLQNAESNAEVQGLDVETLVLSHVQVNRAPHLRRRTYRAHGRINPYMSSPCHVEFILTQKNEAVAKVEDETKVVKRRRNRLNNGASAE